MELTVREERSNPYLNRVELTFAVRHPGGAVPKRSEVRAAIAESRRVPLERVVIERMRAEFGRPVTVGEAMIYADAAAAKRIARTHILVRNGMAEKPSGATEGTAASGGSAAAPPAGAKA